MEGGRVGTGAGCISFARGASQEVLVAFVSGLFRSKHTQAGLTKCGHEADNYTRAGVPTSQGQV